jgi:hypothetical protein
MTNADEITEHSYARETSVVRTASGCRRNNRSRVRDTSSQGSAQAACPGPRSEPTSDDR